jgi:hypothetical protein
LSEISPLFLFSLPRSGSTLAQRVLATHPAVATTAEPWLLLPLLYSLRERGQFADYDHSWARFGLLEFLAAIPDGGEDAYRGAISAAAIELYRRASPAGARYFLDKTPRYALISSEILETFPKAKAIVLWRNPLSIASSMIETWGKGRWNLYKYRVDLYAGLRGLLDTSAEYPDRILQVRYEDLIDHPLTTWQRVFDYLDLDFEPQFLERFQSVRFQGSMGDPSGKHIYKRLSREPLEKWRSTLAGPLRKRWARRYLAWIGAESLATMGYDIAGLEEALDLTPSSISSLPSDLAAAFRGAAYHLLEPKQIRLKVADLIAGVPTYAHR